MVDQPGSTAKKSLARTEQASILDVQYLKGRVSWIRDELDPFVARDGPDTLRPDNVIILFKFFEQLRTSYLTLEAIRDSRIHLALIEISRRATRWPIRLIEEAEEILLKWESEWGPLSSIKINLYDTGGRLHGISTPEDLQREMLLNKWSRKETAWVNPNLARRNGDLGFLPGDWWINTMFAYHDGIIANPSSDSGVTTCYTQAYALLFFAPRAGVRYDGLYKVSGWRITQDPKTKEINYHISFDRLPSEPPLGPVLEHPTAEELDDYREYKRIRKEIRKNRNLLRHGLRFGASNTASTSTRDRMSIPKKTESHDTTKTIEKLPSKRRGSSLSLRLSAPESPSDRNVPTKSETESENPFFASPTPDDNPFFSGGLDSQTGLGKINTLRPDMINYAPVLQAASAAGAAIDPFFATALEEQASKRAAAFRLSISPPTSPRSAKSMSLGLGGRKPMVGFISTIHEADEPKSHPYMRRDSQSPVLSKG
ncbi:hypothetical protein KCU64_g11781, partial [Aureobasidium melanogenum]